MALKVRCNIKYTLRSEVKVRVFPLDSSCPKKSKTIRYKPRTKLLIVTGHLSKQTTQKT